MTEPEVKLSRWNWRNWPVLLKLIAVLLVPTVVALVVGVLRVVDEAGAVPGYTRVSHVIGVEEQLSGLISALQRERDLATGFAAQGRKGDQTQLNQQFADVDNRAAAIRTAADRIPDLGSTGYPAVLYQVGALHQLRESVTAGNGPVSDVVDAYGAAIDPLVALDASMLRQLDDVAVTDDAAAVQALVASREQVSRQHAIIAAALAEDSMGPVAIDDVRAAAVRLGTEQEAFRAAVTPAERVTLTARVAGDAELARQRLMQQVLDRGAAGDPLAVAPAEWDARTAAAAADIDGVEKQLQTRINDTALALRDSARAAAGWNAVALLFALALGVLVSIFVARSMLRPLGVLRRTALDVAERRLPEAVSRIREGAAGGEIEPVPVYTREEIGQVARAFDEVQRQAVRLAAEQARLRENVNDIFVNLSRRSQSLVERQLQLIDRLESSEQDPEQLDNLFQLDHLATRMRRNSENLLVLAGTEGAKRASRPVRLVDVLRAAVSEVEQYQRLVLHQPPAALILGRTASDLVHLLAELLDNATQFSPPDTQVMVSGGFGSDGAVRIEVMDRGVGMTEAEFAEANEQLGSTPVVDASASRRMGLFVVGRLAVRHGIVVRLRRGDDGIGVCASVLMPSQLVRPIADGAEPRLGAVTRGALPASGAAMSDATAESERPGTTATGAARVPGDFFTPQVPAETNGVGTASANGNGSRPASPDEPADPAAPPGSPPAEPAPGTDRAAGAPRTPPSASPLPRRNVDRAGTNSPPPVPPGPPASPPVAIPAAESQGDLFRPGPVTPPPPAPAAESPPSSIRRRVEARRAEARQDADLRHFTPIFDDVATAWFRDRHVVPVRWADDVQAKPADAAGAAAAESAAAAPAEEHRRVPGSAPGTEQVQERSAPSPAHEPRPEPEPEPVAEAPAAAVTEGAGWGAADEGWRAAQALASPGGGDFTAAGLPRRKPRALLVPGAAGGSAEAAPAAAPVRSAETIRGRLASYQQGIREGRQVRSSASRNEDEPSRQQNHQQETQEETK